MAILETLKYKPCLSFGAGSKTYGIYWFDSYIGWPTKMSLFFFGVNFYKNKENFNIFSSQILEVYRILLVETTLESIMFYYTFSVINTMFVPCTALLYGSTAATRILFWWCPLLSVDCFHKLFLSGTPSENSQAGWDLGNRMATSYRFDTKWVCPMGMPEVFKCYVREMRHQLISWIQHLNTWGIIYSA